MENTTANPTRAYVNVSPNNTNTTNTMQDKVITTKPKKETSAQKYARLKAIPKSKRTPEQEIELLQAKKAIDDAAINKKIREAKQELAQAKDNAILKNLHENGINTENGVKGLLRIRQILHDNHINTEGELRRLFDKIKSTYPQLLSAQ